MDLEILFTNTRDVFVNLAKLCQFDPAKINPMTVNRQTEYSQPTILIEEMSPESLMPKRKPIGNRPMVSKPVINSKNSKNLRFNSPQNLNMLSNKTKYSKISYLAAQMDPVKQPSVPEFPSPNNYKNLDIRKHNSQVPMTSLYQSLANQQEIYNQRYKLKKPLREQACPVSSSHLVENFVNQVNHNFTSKNLNKKEYASSTPKNVASGHYGKYQFIYDNKNISNTSEKINSNPEQINLMTMNYDTNRYKTRILDRNLVSMTSPLVRNSYNTFSEIESNRESNHEQQNIFSYSLPQQQQQLKSISSQEDGVDLKSSNQELVDIKSHKTQTHFTIPFIYYHETLNRLNQYQSPYDISSTLVEMVLKIVLIKHFLMVLKSCVSRSRGLLEVVGF